MTHLSDTLLSEDRAALRRAEADCRTTGDAIRRALRFWNAAHGDEREMWRGWVLDLIPEAREAQRAAILAGARMNMTYDAMYGARA